MAGGPWPANVWMFGLFAVMGVLGINLGCCVWQKMMGMARPGRAHGLPAHAGASPGFRRSGPASPGQFHAWLPPGRDSAETRKIGVSCPMAANFAWIVFISWMTRPCWRSPFRNLTRENFSFDENHAWVTLSKDGRDLFSGPTGIMRPLRRGDTQVTLKKFKSARGGRPGEASPAGFRAVLVVTKNPCLQPVLIFFPLLIISTAVYLALTWRAKNFN